jgi:hypothetical protein
MFIEETLQKDTDNNVDMPSTSTFYDIEFIGQQNDNVDTIGEPTKSEMRNVQQNYYRSSVKY